MKRRILVTPAILVVFVVGVGTAGTARGVGLAPPDLPASGRQADPAGVIIDGLADADLQLLAWEVLSRNPGLAAAVEDARAANARVPQRRSLPDPMLAVTWFAMSPQTRVGPQQATISLAQRLPWFGKLDLEGRAAAFDAIAAHARLEAKQIELLTRIRILYQEVLFEAVQERVIEEERATLARFEELARARYASGAGQRQTVVKLQAEITRADARRLGVHQRRSELIAAINSLRDLPSGTAVRLGSGGLRFDHPVDLPFLRTRAVVARPEVAAADAEVAAADIRVQLAGKRRSPDVTVGLSYGFVGRRDDPAGEANPPQGNGGDILALSGAFNLPVWSESLDAAVEETVHERLAAEERRRAVVAAIEGELGDVGRRILIVRDQLELFDRTLLVQAEESLLAAETAYATGNGGALDLLDAERTLFEIRLGRERTRTDLAVARARLEGVIAGPLDWEN